MMDIEKLLIIQKHLLPSLQSVIIMLQLLLVMLQKQITLLLYRI
jgi:hypothetical protein